MHLTALVRRRTRSDQGFTLIELVLTVSIMGIIVAALTGVVISYLKTTVSTAARITESSDVQFAAVYWQRDVASIGVRSTTYNNAPAVHSFPFVQSVNITPACTLPSGTKIITLAWSSYTVAHPDSPTTATVSYVAAQAGTVWTLTRVRCTGSASTPDSTVTVASNLTAKPTVACTGGGVTGCSDSSGAVPTLITMSMTSVDPDNRDGSTYSAKLSGERRES